MTTVEAYTLLDGYEGEDRQRVFAVLPWFGPFVVDIWPALIVSGARLVGWLDDCAGIDDLREAFEHFQSCCRMELFTDDEMQAELNDVVSEWVRFSTGLAEVTT
jgi:hypothetical protein